MRAVLWLAGAILAVLGGTPAGAAPVTETIALLRHGEKPAEGLGRLDCRGRNRAAALPAVIAREIGRPDAIFAPDPDRMKKDQGVKYPYRRPLETVAPASAAFGVPIDTRFGYKQIEELQGALEAPQLARATILVAWEHKKLEKLARALLEANGGDAAQVPHWRGDDFDGIYIIRITRDGGRSSATFERHGEGLDGQPDHCPGH